MKYRLGYLAINILVCKTGEISLSLSLSFWLQIGKQGNCWNWYQIKNTFGRFTPSRVIAQSVLEGSGKIKAHLWFTLGACCFLPRLLGEDVAGGAGAPGQGCAPRRTWLTLVGRLCGQFPEGAEKRAAEQEQDGEVTIHVAGAEGSERSISPGSMPLM